MESSNWFLHIIITLINFKIWPNQINLVSFLYIMILARNCLFSFYKQNQLMHWLLKLQICYQRVKSLRIYLKIFMGLMNNTYPHTTPLLLVPSTQQSLPPSQQQRPECQSQWKVIMLQNSAHRFRVNHEKNWVRLCNYMTHACFFRIAFVNL